MTLGGGGWVGGYWETSQSVTGWVGGSITAIFGVTLLCNDPLLHVSRCSYLERAVGDAGLEHTLSLPCRAAAAVHMLVLLTAPSLQVEGG